MHKSVNKALIELLNCPDDVPARRRDVPRVQFVMARAPRFSVRHEVEIDTGLGQIPAQAGARVCRCR